MGKYNFQLDLTTHNTLRTIVDRIQDGSRVLEFGPANGRLTRYLQSSKACLVDIVEIDYESGQEAARYANEALLGVQDGDIEKYIWVDKFKGNKYDCIVFADVLEHLFNPKNVLEQCKSFLNDRGKVLLSIPNIANNAIILNLLQNEFNYTSTGILDDTHIRFFTNKSFERMVSAVDFNISYIDAILGKVGTMEIPVTYSMFDNDMDAIKQHDYGDVYQWVYELVLEKVVCVDDRTIQYKRGTTLPLVYIGTDDGYIEDKTYVPDTVFDGEIYTASFDITAVHNKLRFDPIENQFCSFTLVDVRTDVPVYSINPGNMYLKNGENFLFFNDDPYVEFIGDFQRGTYFTIKYKLQVISHVKGLMDKCNDMEKRSCFRNVICQVRPGGDHELFSTIYFDTGNGFLPDGVIQQVIFIEEDGTFKCNCTIQGVKAIKRVRFDPCEKMIAVQITNCTINENEVVAKAVGDYEVEDGYDVFFTQDPQYAIVLDTAMPELKLTIMGQIDIGANWEKLILDRLTSISDDKFQLAKAKEENNKLREQLNLVNNK